MGRFRSKLVSSGLDKHASVSKQTHQLSTESVHYKFVMFLQYRPQYYKHYFSCNQPTAVICCALVRVGSHCTHKYFTGINKCQTRQLIVTKAKFPSILPKHSIHNTIYLKLMQGFHKLECFVTQGWKGWPGTNTLAYRT